MINNIDHLDSWSLSGGAVDENETLEQAVFREVKEETGLFIKVRSVAYINERFFSNIKFVPYYKNGLKQLISSSATYSFQD